MAIKVKKRPLKTRTYASGHTYIRIGLHVRTRKPTYIYMPEVSGSVISNGHL